jgi:5'-3' exonuclease
VFPYYKANRKKARDATDLDWNAIFDCMKKIREELAEYFPYKVINVDGAEADDVIGTLVHAYGNDMTQPILILSGDKDFIQLQQYLNVKQYDPIRKKFIAHNNPALYTKEHIIKGDAGDGIPNFLSPDNSLVVGTRQKPITTKKLETWLQLTPEQFDDETMLRNYKRNQQLIDLTFIPEDVKSRVINEYENQKNKGRSKLFNYFVSRKLKNLMENINEF